MTGGLDHEQHPWPLWQAEADAIRAALGDDHAYRRVYSEVRVYTYEKRNTEAREAAGLFTKPNPHAEAREIVAALDNALSAIGRAGDEARILLAQHDAPDLFSRGPFVDDLSEVREVVARYLDSHGAAFRAVAIPNRGRPSQDAERRLIARLRALHGMTERTRFWDFFALATPPLARVGLAEKLADPSNRTAWRTAWRALERV